jgi:hypothetical protein
MRSTPQARYMRDRRRDYLSRRLCLDCALPLEAEENQICTSCRGARRVRSRRYRAKMVQVWRELGKCLDCGMERVPTFTRCAFHLERNQEVKQARVVAGKCMDCVNPPAIGRKRCQRCLDRNAQYNKERRCSAQTV